MSRFGRTEKTIFVCAVLLLLAFSYFLYDDSLLFPKHQNGSLELIGDVSNSQNDVRRKNLDTFSWLPAAKKDKIFQNDSIYTGERSEATVRLQDGTLIRIQPNSLITLNLKNGQMNLDLRYGNLVGEIAKGSSLTIQSGNEEFKLESSKDGEKSEVQLNKSHSGVVDLKLVKGQVQLNKKDLPKDAVIAVSKKGEVKTLETPVLTLVTADNITFARTVPDSPLEFKWFGKGDISRYQIELAPTVDFSTLSTKQITPDSEIRIVSLMAPGQYFWRIKAYNSSGQLAVTSETRRVQISSLLPPEILSPVQSALIQLELQSKPNEVLSTSTEIQWKATSQLKVFTWQLAQEETFEKVLKEDQTVEFKTLTPRLVSGTYWVRVRGTTENNESSMWSQPVLFSLNLNAKIEQRPARPILITKAIVFKAPTSSERTPATEMAPKMTWKPVLQSKIYHVQVSNDLSFKDAQKFDAPQTEVTWSRYRPGKYYYRVFARGLNGLVSDPSEVGTLDISVNNPLLNPIRPIFNMTSNPTPMNTSIAWTEMPIAKSYLVEIDKNKQFTSPQKIEYTTTNGVLTIPRPGTYQVRVQALDENSEPIGGFSNIEEVLYTARPALTTPQLMEPFNKASIFLQTAMEPFIWLEWRTVEGATTYSLEVSDKADFSNTLIKTSLSGNRFLLKEKVPLGKIYWRVRAEDPKNTELSEWAKAREFVIYSQKNETFVK